MNLEGGLLNFLEFIGDLDFNIFGALLFVSLFIFWLVLIGWVWIDSGERTTKLGYRIAYVLLVIILNIPGLIIYLIVRPSDTIEQIYWADLERRYLKYETAELTDCPKCCRQMFPGYVFCSNCGYEIKRKCPECEVMINKESKFCYFCGSQVNIRSAKEDVYPNVEVMEQQILASKEEATERVESRKTRYKHSSGLVVKLGELLISSANRVTDATKNLFLKKDKPSKQEKVEKVEVIKVKRKKRKRKGKRK
jgi:hypothetical protein